MKKISKFLIPLLMTGMFTGCNWQIPKSVSVTTDADYYVSLGSFGFDFTKYVNTDELLKKLKDGIGNNADVFDLQTSADNDTLTYMMHYPFYNIPFDLQQYLNSMNMDSILGSSALSSMDQAIAVPAISAEQKIEKNVSDLLGDLLNKVQSQEVSLSISAPEIGVSTPQEVYQNVTIESHYAKGVKYKSGSKIKLTVSRTDSEALGAGYAALCKVVIDPVETDGYAFEGFTSDYVDVTNGGTIEIPLDKGYVPYELPARLYCKYNGGQLTAPVTVHEYNANFVMDNAVIEEIAEINLAGGPGDAAIDNPSLTIDNVTVSAGTLPELFINAEIGAGGVELNSELPEGWSGITLDLSSLNINGLGLSLTESDFSDHPTAGYMMKQEASLSGQTISSSSGSDITVGATLAVNCDGATFKIADDTKISTEFKISVSAINEINLNVESLSYKLDDDGAVIQPTVTKYVKNIYFQDPSNPGKKHNAASELVDGDGFGLKCNVVNTLPAGNSIPVTITSAIFGLTDSNKIVNVINGNGNETPVETKINSYPTIELNDGKIDLSVDFGSPKTIDGTEYTNCLTLSNIVPGMTYQLKISDITMLCDWEKIDVNLQKTKVVNGQMDLAQISMDQLLNALPLPAEDVKKLSMSHVNTYFYAQKPNNAALSEVLGNLSLTGNMTCSYTDKDGTDKVKDILEDGSTINFADVVAWPESSTGSVSYKDSPEFIAALSKDKASFFCDMADILNDFPSALKLDYNLNLQSSSADNIELYAYQLSGMSGDDVSSISIDVAIEIPFEFAIDGAINLDIMQMVNSSSSSDSSDSADPATPADSSTKDLFNRTSANSTEEYARYAGGVEYIKLDYNLTNDVIKGLDGNLIIKDDVSGLDKTASFESGAHSLSFTGEEIKKVLTSYPFNPSVLVKLGKEDTKSTMNLSRSGLNNKDALKCKLAVGLKLNNDTPIELYNINTAK